MFRNSIEKVESAKWRDWINISLNYFHICRVLDKWYRWMSCVHFYLIYNNYLINVLFLSASQKFGFVYCSFLSVHVQIADEFLIVDSKRRDSHMKVCSTHYLDACISCFSFSPSVFSFFSTTLLEVHLLCLTISLVDACYLHLILYN